MTKSFAARPDLRRSWIAQRQAKPSDLLYVSDESTNDVYVFTYPAGVLVGTITGLSTPQGECADPNQDIYVTEFSPPDILEYQHGGTTSVKTLVDPGVYPQGCAVDPMTRNLAVANFRNTAGGPGSVSIYKAASGTPTVYSNPDVLISEFTLAYDDKGNICSSTGSTPMATSHLPSLPKAPLRLKRSKLARALGTPAAFSGTASMLRWVTKRRLSFTSSTYTGERRPKSEAPRS